MFQFVDKVLGLTGIPAMASTELFGPIAKVIGSAFQGVLAVLIDDQRETVLEVRSIPGVSVVDFSEADFKAALDMTTAQGAGHLVIIEHLDHIRGDSDAMANADIAIQVYDQSVRAHRASKAEGGAWLGDIIVLDPRDDKFNMEGSPDSWAGFTVKGSSIPMLSMLREGGIGIPGTRKGPEVRDVSQCANCPFLDTCDAPEAQAYREQHSVKVPRLGLKGLTFPGRGGSHGDGLWN